GELVIVRLAQLADDAVEGAGHRAGRRRLRRIVAGRLQRVAEVGQAELDAGGRDAARVLTEDAEVRVRSGRQLDLLLDLAGRVAQEAQLDLLAALPAARHH